MISRVTDHADRAVARLPAQFRENPDVVGLVRALCLRAQELEDALWALATERFLRGSGAQLDQVGALLTEPREGATDEAYRLRLTARARALRSSGTIPDLLAVFKLMLPENDVVVRHHTHASYLLDVGLVSDPSLVPTYQRFASDAQSAGVNGQVLHWRAEESEMLTYEDARSPNGIGAGLGDARDPGSGGRYASAEAAKHVH